MSSSKTAGRKHKRDTDAAASSASSKKAKVERKESSKKAKVEREKSSKKAKVERKEISKKAKVEREQSSKKVKVERKEERKAGVQGGAAPSPPSAPSLVMREPNAGPAGEDYVERALTEEEEEQLAGLVRCGVCSAQLAEDDQMHSVSDGPSDESAEALRAFAEARPLRWQLVVHAGEMGEAMCAPCLVALKKRSGLELFCAQCVIGYMVTPEDDEQPAQCNLCGWVQGDEEQEQDDDE